MSFLTQPVVALFISIALGYLIGRIRIGPVQVGGICGTLFVALALGQLGVTLDKDLKDTAFALFIFALGFTAGPQFFGSLRTGWRYGIFSVIEVVTVLLLLAAAVLIWGFDAGTTAGLFAGAATESAVLGTAAEAMTHLDLPATEIASLQGNMATAYSITYLFGLVSIVVFTTQVAPLLLRINLKEASRALAKELGEDDEDAIVEGLPSLVGRAFHAGPAAGARVSEIEAKRRYLLTVEAVIRDGKLVDGAPDLVLQPDDIALLIGLRRVVIAASEQFGDEVPVPEELNVPVETREVVLLNKEAVGRKLGEIRARADANIQRGVFVTRVERLNRTVPLLPGTLLAQGDVLTIYGSEAALDRATPALGQPLPPADKTDFIWLGLGIVAGLLLGSLSLKWGHFDLTLGTGGGALVAGLIFGWLHMRKPRRGTLPVPAAEFMKDFGLATFIAAVGLSTGPDAIRLIMQFGLILPVLGIVVSVIPGLVSLAIGHWLMKLPGPILLGAIAGQHCSTPTITALVNQSESSIPVTGYTVTYAISNVLLPLMGPIVVGLATSLT